MINDILYLTMSGVQWTILNHVYKELETTKYRTCSKTYGHVIITFLVYLFLHPLVQYQFIVIDVPWSIHKNIAEEWRHMYTKLETKLENNYKSYDAK